jgi:galactokinase
MGEQVSYPADPLPTTARKHWSDYPIGVAWSLAQEGVRVGGFDLSLAGNVPLGAGLSSSASIEVATALALLALAGTSLPLATIALACQRAENAFVGARSGIMDQFIACAGQQDHALLLDCRSLEYRLLPIPPNVRLIICNSMVKHEHAGGEYNARRAEVEEGTRILHRRWPSIVALRDATEAQLVECEQQMPENVFRRCRHIITENKRVELAASALERGDLPAFGVLMAEAHRSIRDDFQASCSELDTLVEIASSISGCYGARMTGGGFGGCTVNLVEESQAQQFREAIHNRYRASTGIDADIYLCRASAGATRIS